MYSVPLQWLSPAGPPSRTVCLEQSSGQEFRALPGRQVSWMRLSEEVRKFAFLSSYFFFMREREKEVGAAGSGQGCAGCWELVCAGYKNWLERLLDCELWLAQELVQQIDNYRGNHGGVGGWEHGLFSFWASLKLPASFFDQGNTLGDPR